MSKTAKKEMFAALGNITMAERTSKDGTVINRKVFLPNSPDYFTDQLQNIPEGPISIKFEKYVSTRSREQLAYHWVLMSYLATHTGYTKEEMHDAIMCMKFGTKKLSIGTRTIEVRKSISDRSMFPKGDMSELIEFDLGLCDEMDVKVPTPEELGYISNYEPYHRPLTPVRKAEKHI